MPRPLDRRTSTNGSTEGETQARSKFTRAKPQGKNADGHAERDQHANTAPHVQWLGAFIEKSRAQLPNGSEHGQQNEIAAPHSAGSLEPKNTRRSDDDDDETLMGPLLETLMGPMLTMMTMIMILRS